MSLELPTGKEIKKLVKAAEKFIDVELQRLETEEFIAKILGAKPRAYFESITFNGVKLQGEITMAELREGQRITATVALKTKAGNPASYQKGTEAWTSSDPTVATVTPHADDPLTADIDGVNGAANTPVLVTFKCDGDPDDNESRDVVATLDVVVTQGEAFVAEITPGTPADIPPAP